MRLRTTSGTARPSFEALHLAGLLAWLAVAIGLWRQSPAWRAVHGFAARPLAMALLGLFLVAFASVGALERSAAGRAPGSALRLLVLTGSTFALMALGVSDLSAILLIIVAAVVATNYGPRITIAALILVNAGFLAIAHWVWRAADTVFLVMVYGSFEAFAALTTSARRRSEAAAAELRRVNAELLATRALLAESSRDGERLRVSRELHDVAGHKLTALNLNLELLGHDPLMSGRPELGIARQLGDELLGDIRAVVSRLRRDDGIDLREALRRLAELFPQPAILIEVAEDLRVEDAERAEVLLRAAQEALTNSVRHARARQAWVRLLHGAAGIELRVEDDGAYEGSHTDGNGLTGLRERVAAVGGQLAIGRRAEGGWRMSVSLPARNCR